MENEGGAALIYHERQRLQLCLLHTLNNLFQEEVFTRSSLNSIAETLMTNDPDDHAALWPPFSLFVKPHHNPLTGNYDVNVLITALESKGVAVVWHDRRNGAAAVDLDNGLFGIVLNINVIKWAGLWKSRHWIALRKIDEIWFNLDSELREPARFESNDELREFLDLSIKKGGELLLIMKKKE